MHGAVNQTYRCKPEIRNEMTPSRPALPFIRLGYDRSWCAGYLLAPADRIEEVEVTCQYCGKTEAARWLRRVGIAELW